MKYLIILIIISVIILSGCSVEQKISELPKEYQDLRDRCDLMVTLAINPNNVDRVKDAQNCCFKSIIKMSEEGYKSAHTKDSYGRPITQCPEEYKMDSLDCEGSYNWCEPISSGVDNSDTSTQNKVDFRKIQWEGECKIENSIIFSCAYGLINSQGGVGIDIIKSDNNPYQVTIQMPDSDEPSPTTFNMVQNNKYRTFFLIESKLSKGEKIVLPFMIEYPISYEDKFGPKEKTQGTITLWPES